MKLFKNVDIADLKSILARGILSMDESGNNNWNPKKRALTLTLTEEGVGLFGEVAQARFAALAQALKATANVALKAEE